jgi:hypothetical protein
VKINRVALLLWLGLMLTVASQAQIQHVEMRVEGMT